MSLDTFVKVRVSARHKQALRALTKFYGAGPSETVRTVLYETAFRLGLWPAQTEPETAGDNGQQEAQHAEQ